MPFPHSPMSISFLRETNWIRKCCAVDRSSLLAEDDNGHFTRLLSYIIPILIAFHLLHFLSLEFPLQIDLDDDCVEGSIAFNFICFSLLLDI